jgi:hypothetical protein
MLNGDSWTEEERVGGTGGRSGYFPSLAASEGGVVHLLYQQDRSGRIPGEIYYRVNDGAGWSSPLALTDATARAHCPSIATGPGSLVHAVWHDGRNSSGDIRYRKFNGTDWEPEVQVENHDAVAQYPSVAVEQSGAVHFVWEDHRAGNPEIYHKVLRESWSPDQRVTWGRHTSTFPCFALDASGQGYLVWTDARDGNNEIYFKCRTSTLTGVSEDSSWPGGISTQALIRSIWPQPVSHSVTLEFGLPINGLTVLQIFDVRGRFVRTLINNPLAAGVHRVLWDGRNAQGEPVASGVYFCRLVTNSERETSRLLIIR